MSSTQTHRGEAAAVNRGYSTLNVHSAVASFTVSIRLLVVCTALTLAAFTCALISMFFGDFPLTFADVVESLTGRADEFTSRVVLEWRLPVAVAALVFGAVLGLGGAIFQSLTRNPLGSPDIIGFDSGSYTAVILTMLVLRIHNYWTVAAMALIGGFVTALIVYLLAYRKGSQGFRLIIVGIGVSAMLGSLNSYLVTRADLADAMQVGFWAAGSIARVTWTSMAPSLLIAAVIFCAAFALAPHLQTMELGDDAALSLGVPATRARLFLLIIGVATTALVTAAAGPIGFIALIAPQLAHRITNGAGATLLGASCMGAALLSAAHVLAHIISALYRPIPVGLLTVCVGGCYLIWLLSKEARMPLGGSA